MSTKSSNPVFKSLSNVFYRLKTVTLSIFKTIVLVLVLGLGLNQSFAQENLDSETGGNTSGGGNPIEADFIGKANRIADYLDRVKSQLSSAKLRDSVEDFIVVVRASSMAEGSNEAINEAIKVKCTSKEREFEQSRRNEAFTYYYQKRLIEIQCAEYRNNTLDEVKATWMILHEFGRALNVEDNTYSWSKQVMREFERISGIKAFTPLKDRYCLVAGTEKDDSVRICSASSDPITLSRKSLFSVDIESNLQFSARIRHEVNNMVGLGQCSHSAVTWEASENACQNLQILRQSRAEQDK